MALVKTVSKLLFYISRILAAAYLGTTLYALICLLFHWNTSPYGGGKYLHINYPFTQQPFLNIDDNYPYIIFSFLMPLGLYGTFFWWASNVFKVFFQSRLFTQQNIVHLRRFYLLNLTVPIAATALSSFFVPIEGAVWALVTVHFVLGAFAYFLAAIFQQGLHLQREQDLII